MKTIKQTFLTSLLPLVLEAKRFSPALWGRANFKAPKSLPFVGTDGAAPSPAPLASRELLSLLRGGGAPPPPPDGPPRGGDSHAPHPDVHPPPPRNRQPEYREPYVSSHEIDAPPPPDGAPPQEGRRRDRTDWVGGYRARNPKLDYPKVKPDLSSLPMTGNHDNVEKLDRMMRVRFPEFSWLMDKGDPSSRRYVKFYDDISRIAYTNKGRVYSIICPQLGFDLSRVGLCGTFNVEVHVSNVRGWVDEDTRAVCADLNLEAIIWIDMNEVEKKKYPLRALVQEALNKRKFPFSKEHGMRIAAHHVQKPFEKNCPLLNGTDINYPVPQYAEHHEVFSVAHIATQVRDTRTGDENIDDFNDILFDIMEIGLPGMLSPGSIIDWNLWFEPPEPVNQTEWREHTEAMRLSVNDHDNRTSFDKHLAHVKDYDGNLVYTGTLTTMLSRKNRELFKKMNKYIVKHHPNTKVARFRRLAILYWLVHASRHLLLSDKTNEKGKYLFRPYVYTVIDVVVQVAMAAIIYFGMWGPAKIWLGTMVALHGIVILFTDYGIEGKVFKNIPIWPVSTMLKFDKALLLSFAANPFIFGKYMYPWVRYVSVINAYISWFGILPRLDMDPSPTVTIGIGKKKIMI